MPAARAWKLWKLWSHTGDVPTHSVPPCCCWQVCHAEAATNGASVTDGKPRVLLVAYEDLAYRAGAADSWAALQRWLGLAPRSLPSSTVKMTAANLSRSIANFGELERLLAAEFGASSRELEHLRAPQ